MAKIIAKNYAFPSQAVSDTEKKTKEYGLSVGRAIEQEWFNKDNNGIGKFYNSREECHRLRLYARGEQSIRKYKDEFAINGDLSYLNLDWKPVPIIPKFIDIVVNGMQDRSFTIKAVGQDTISTGRRTKFVNDVQQDLNTADLLLNIEKQLQISARNFPVQDLPANTEELELYMQLNYKQGIELAEEQAIDNIFKSNSYEATKRRLDYDLATIGIACAKHSFNNTDGVVVDYVDPANLVWSYTEDPNFEDCYYFGEVKNVNINELKKQFPDLDNEEIQNLTEKGSNWNTYNTYNQQNSQTTDGLAQNNTVTVLNFNWKTWEHDVYKIKEVPSGAEKAIEKDDSFDPPKEQSIRFKKVKQTREVIYEGVLVLGTSELLKWEKASNMIRPNANINKVMMNYIASAPRIYKGSINSLVAKMTPYADLIQLTHLKLQQAIQRMTPSGVFLDADGLAEIDLGNGNNYNPQEALNMYFQTGSIIGRSLTVEGDQNLGKVPITELPGSSGGQVKVLVGAYNQYLQMIRDVTGLNEARDGSDPDPYALVGVQKLAAANSNVATRHILYSSMFITSKLAEAISLRFKDVLEFHPTKQAFIDSIGQFSVGSLEEVKDLSLHDFGIFIELEPDEDEKAILESNIQMALSKENIFLEDAIDIREVKNIKLANQLLKFRRLAKQQTDRQMAQAASAAQARAQGEAQIAMESAKADAEQVKTSSKIQLSKAENEFGIRKMEIETRSKKELMQYEFNLNVQLKELELKSQMELADRSNASMLKREVLREQGKIASSKLSGAPNTDKPIKDFESKGNDTLGGFDMGRFEAS